MNNLIRPLTAEFVGTCLFVFLGAASVVGNSGTSSAIGAVGIATAHGLALAILVTATMRISGGHLNPAVTLGLLAIGKTDGRTAGAYVGAQLLGAVLGALLVKLLYPAGPVAVMSVGAPGLANNVTFLQGTLVEAVLTFFLMSAVLGTAVSSDAPAVGGFGIGLAVTVGALVGAPLTGAAMNPARAFGPALVGLDMQAQAIYWIGPILGAVAAAFVWKLVLLPKDPARI